MIAATVGEAAIPLTVLGVGVAGQTYTMYRYYKTAEDNWQDAQKAKTMPPSGINILPMEEADPLPLPVPDSKPKDIPFAEPTAKPKVTDLPNAPTDLIPAPKAKPETKVEDLPQPYTPDVPKGTPPTSQQEPPQTPKDILPPIIGATTAVAGKAAADALKTENQSAALPPELDKIRAGLKDPIALKSFDQRYAQIQSDAQLDDTKKLAKFNGYLESAKQLGNGDLEQGLVKDLQEYTFRRGLNLPYGAENRMTFAEFGKQVRQGFEKPELKTRKHIFRVARLLE